MVTENKGYWANVVRRAYYATSTDADGPINSSSPFLSPPVHMFLLPRSSTSEEVTADFLQESMFVLSINSS